jgi:hypothetical protein
VSPFFHRFFIRNQDASMHSFVGAHIFLRLVFTVVALSSCQSSEAYYGRGKLDLSWVVRARFADYLKEPSANVFAVSEDGNSFNYRYCPTQTRCSSEDAVYYAIKGCEINSGGVPCKVYAMGSTVVWKE